MSDTPPLPSREEAATGFENWDERTRVTSWGRIMEAYVSGRLVDSEAIDYEALAHLIGIDVFGPSWIDLTPVQRQWARDMAPKYLDAAIGEA